MQDFHMYVNVRYPDKIPQKITLNAIEREPVTTRVLNPNASEARYKPKQRSYRKTKLKILAIVRRRVPAPDSPGT